jgi:hypothetical protein
MSGMAKEIQAINAVSFFFIGFLSGLNCGGKDNKILYYLHSMNIKSCKVLYSLAYYGYICNII